MVLCVCMCVFFNWSLFCGRKYCSWSLALVIFQNLNQKVSFGKTTALNTCWIFFSGSGGQNLNSKYRKSPGQWILNDMWHFQFLCFICFHSCNLFIYSFTQQRCTGKQHLAIVCGGLPVPSLPLIHSWLIVQKGVQLQGDIVLDKRGAGVSMVETEAWSFRVKRKMFERQTEDVHKKYRKGNQMEKKKEHVPGFEVKEF